MPHVGRPIALALFALLFASGALPASALSTSVAALRVPGDVTGAGVVVAVLDTGVDDEHESFRGAFATGVDLSPTASLFALEPREVACSNPDDTEGHGTHVAGIALGRGNSEGARRGVAPGALLVDVKVALDFTPASVADGLARGLEWVRDYNAGRTACRDEDAPRIHVVSISMASPEPGDPDDAASRLVDELVASGVVVVASAGNCGPDSEANVLQCSESGNATIASPGVARGAITVAAVDDRGSLDRADDSIAGFSSRGPNGGERKPNLAAPGVGVESAAASRVPSSDASGWVARDGTSQAAPHVAGIAALLLQVAPTLSPADVKSILMASAEDRGAPGWDAEWGAGYADATAALALAKPKPNARPVAEMRVACELLDCELDASASRDDDGDALAFSWEFGDGVTASGSLARHTFPDAGDWLVRLTVRDARGAESVASRSVALALAPGVDDAPAVSSAQNAAPEAVATVTPREGPPGTEFSFDASASRDPDGTVASFGWDLDADGVPDADGPTLAWTPEREGVQVVRLHVIDDEGAVDVETLTVLVDAALSPIARDEPSDAPRSDASPPTIEILSPASGAIVASPLVARWRVSDDSVSVAVSATLDGVPVPDLGADSVALAAAPGAHAFALRAVDGAGNVAERVVAFMVPEVGGGGVPDEEVRVVMGPVREEAAKGPLAAERSVPSAPALAALAAFALVARLRRR